MCGCPADYTAMGEQARDLNKRHRIKTKIINVDYTKKLKNLQRMFETIFTETEICLFINNQT